MTYFDDRQRAEVAKLLKLKPGAEFDTIETKVADWVEVFKAKQKRKDPERNPTKAERWADVVSAAANKLKNAAHEFPDPMISLLYDKRAAGKKWADWGEVHRDALARREFDRQFIATLRILATNADAMVKSEEYRRQVFRLNYPPQTVSVWLWPKLFLVWEKAGQIIAHSEDGPLHRFLALVHEAGSLNRVAPRTLRGAGETWKKKPEKRPQIIDLADL